MFNSFIIAIGTLLLLLTIEAKRVDNPPPEAPILPEQVQAGQSATIGGHQIHKLKKPKSLKTITDYELCKQECKRKRDQESMGEVGFSSFKQTFLNIFSMSNGCKRS